VISPRRRISATSEWSSVICSNVAAAQAIGAAVADVRDERDAVGGEERSHARGAHARESAVALRLAVHHAVGRLEARAA